MTTVDIEDLAQALGFNNTQEMNEFQCEMQQGTNDLKATYIDPFVTNPEDSFTILGATERYATTAITPAEFDENTTGNFGLIMGGNGCNGEPGLITNKVTGLEIFECLAKVAVDVLGVGQLKALATEILEFAGGAKWDYRRSLKISQTKLLSFVVK